MPLKIPDRRKNERNDDNPGNLRRPAEIHRTLAVLSPKYRDHDQSDDREAQDISDDESDLFREIVRIRIETVLHEFTRRVHEP
jgi:hypothetical protein